MTDSDPNNRHLKSRIAHLELMWDRERKRCNDLESSLRAFQQQQQQPQQLPQSSPVLQQHAPQRRFSRTSSSSPGTGVVPIAGPAGSSGNDHPLVSPANSPILTDPSRLERLRRMSGELDHERKLKVDLMANLKQTTDAKQEAERELEEMRRSRDALQAKLDEVQDEFEELWLTMRSQLAELPEEQPPTDPTQQHASLSAMSLRQFVQSLEAGYEQRQRTLLHSLLDDDRAAVDHTVPIPAIEKRVRTRIEDLEKGTLDAVSVIQLCQLLEHLGPVDTTSSISDRCQEACDKSLRRILALEADVSTYRRYLTNVVPTHLESIFTTLSRSSSFTPVPILTIDAFEGADQESYRHFLQTNTDALSHTIRKYMSSHTKSRQKISYRQFGVGDLALFLPTRNAGSHSWAAFNVNAPHYFLDMRGVKVEGKDFLIGRIERIQDYIGEAGVLERSQLAAATSPDATQSVDVVEPPADSVIGSPDDLESVKPVGDASRRWWLVQIAQKTRSPPAMPAPVIAP